MMDSNEKRFLSTTELMRYWSLGRNNTLEISRQIGATRRFPGIRRIVHDKRKVDEYLDQLRQG